MSRSMLQKALNNLIGVESELRRAMKNHDALDLRDRLLSAEENVANQLRARSEVAWVQAMSCVEGA